MRLKSFLGLVEIRTKLASAIPLMLGTFYTLYHFGTFRAVNFAVMLGSLLAFDMVTTALNNYFDFKRAKRKTGYNYERHNTIVRDQLRESSVIGVIVLLLSIATLLGILLVFKTNLVVLLAGMLSFAVGICYSFGPVPISRTPLGEVLSGFFMGFVILFLSVYIHVFDRGILSVGLDGPNFLLQVDILETAGIFLLSLPLICGIANIMLANNICDMEDDLENRRYTLPIYLGRERALCFFKWTYILAYLDILLMVVIRIIPPAALLLLPTFIPVYRNIKRFYALQTKKDTFALSVKNFMLINVPLVLLLMVYFFISTIK